MNNGILNSERRESYPSGLREKPLLFQMSTKMHRRSSEQIPGEERVDFGYQKFMERSPKNFSDGQTMRYNNQFRRGSKTNTEGGYSSRDKMRELSLMGGAGPSEWISPERPKTKMIYSNYSNSYFYPKNQSNPQPGQNQMNSQNVINTMQAMGSVNQIKPNSQMNQMNQMGTMNSMSTMSFLNSVNMTASPNIHGGNKMGGTNLSDLKNILEEDVGANNTGNSMSDSCSDEENEDNLQTDDAILINNKMYSSYPILNHHNHNDRNFNGAGSNNYFLNRRQSISNPFPVTPMFQYTSSSFVKTDRPPLPTLLNYTSNSNSTCSSVKEDPNITTNSYSTPLNVVDKRKNSLQLNHSNSFLGGFNFNQVQNGKRKSFAYWESEHYRQHFLNGGGNLTNNVLGNNLGNNTNTKKNFTFKNSFNKFNLSQNSENTEILTVKFNLEGEKVINVRRFDDVLISTKNFCDKNKLHENFVKPIVNKISESLSYIYKVYNTDVERSDAEYLKSLNLLSANSKGQTHLEEESNTSSDTSFDKDITSISSITLIENELFDGAEEEVIYGQNLCKINKSF